MAYSYDAFISYRQAFPFDSWMDEHFLPFFRSFLTGALDREPVLFIDRLEIHPGQAWPQRLQRALAQSRCLIGLWTPQYFHSDWCRRECDVMLFREQHLGWRSVDNPDGLVVPVCLFDGQHFPSRAKEIQHRDFRRFVRLGDGFKGSNLYVEMQAAIEDFAADVAEVIRLAPRWRREWQTQRFLSPAPLLLPSQRLAQNPGLE